MQFLCSLELPPYLHQAIIFINIQYIEKNWFHNWTKFKVFLNTPEHTLYFQLSAQLFHQLALRSRIIYAYFVKSNSVYINTSDYMQWILNRLLNRYRMFIISSFSTVASVIPILDIVMSQYLQKQDFTFLHIYFFKAVGLRMSQIYSFFFSLSLSLCYASRARQASKWAIGRFIASFNVYISMWRRVYAIIFYIFLIFLKNFQRANVINAILRDCI